MTSLQIVALYAGLNLLLMPILMYRVGLARQAAKVNLGDGGDQNLLQRIRAEVLDRERNARWVLDIIEAPAPGT